MQLAALRAAQAKLVPAEQVEKEIGRRARVPAFVYKVIKAMPKDAHPLTNAGLELTGPWHPLDMAFNALNSPAPMNMPDFEDAAPPHFRPAGTPRNEPLGIFAALENAKEIFEGRWAECPYEVVKKGRTRAYRINKPPAEWPTRFARPPGIHVRYGHITVDGRPAPGMIPITLLWALNNYGSLTRLGTGLYYYLPKTQTPQEALIVEKLLVRLEGLIGAEPKMRTAHRQHGAVNDLS